MSPEQAGGAGTVISSTASGAGTQFERQLLTIPSLVIAVTFFYVGRRLVYLSKIASQFATLGDKVFVYIVTNTRDEAERANIHQAMAGSNVQFSLITPHLLGHPFLLTWTHLAVFRHALAEDEYTHFMYVEDDILVKKENIRYWLKGREQLREFGLYPSFLRYEQKTPDGPAYSSDAFGTVDPKSVARVLVNKRYGYINMPWPYQGMYLLDRELMKEHLGGPSSNPDFGVWGIREKATQALTFSKVPPGFTSRNVLGYRLDRGRIDEHALVHHTPNNYVTMEGTQLGKTLIRDLVTPPMTD